VHGVTPVWVRVLREFAEANGTEVVGVACDGPAALRLIAEHKPDLFVTETSCEHDDAFVLVEDARRLAPSLKIIVIGDAESGESIGAAVEAGADVYVVKNADPGDVAAAMRHAFGQPYYIQSPRLVAARRPTANRASRPRVSLTKREREILQLVSEGHTNAAMASMLWLTEQTIKFHLSNLYRKLEVANRTEAARWARDNGAAVPAVAGVS
jgi:DNA-binding NarL/FixJ family response regulator